MDDLHIHSMKQQLDVSPAFSIYDVANMTSRDVVALCQISLQDSPGSIFLANSQYNILIELALSVPTTSIVEWVFDKVMLCMLTEGTHSEVRHTIVGADTILMVSGEARIRRLKKCHGDYAVDELSSVLAIFAENTGRIADVIGPIAQNTPMQNAPVNSYSRQTPYVSKRAGFIKSFIARYWFPTFFDGSVMAHNCSSSLDDYSSLYNMSELLASVTRPVEVTSSP